jgi:NADPH-dependent glutamate synthase beta subunit-like oxidoreductase/NAD-dependent dihydropyrimidine dehydrogenase PreA subunit
MPPRFSKELQGKVTFPDYLSYQPRTSPCETNCPASNPIQKVNALIKESRTEEALEYLRSRNPFPGITGRVCAHPCEQTCNRSKYDEGLSIRALERFAADHADLTRIMRPGKRARSGKTLAIIGSGPAGMTCAYFSALLGHDVTVFESSPTLGGIPRIGIPDFRLPKDVVDREVGQILEVGVRARPNTTVGRDIEFDKILSDFDACLVAVGTWKEKSLDVPGSESSMSALSFLKQVNLGRRDPIGDRVVIMGGGGVAFDCAFTAKRLGALEVHVICVEEMGNLCASAEDIVQAEAEEILIHGSRMISRVLNDAGKATGIEYFKISSFQFDQRDRLSVQSPGSERGTLSADTVISAVGVRPALKFLEGNHPFRFTLKGTLEVNPNTFATSVDGVFGAGDAVSGPSTVAQAIGSGRRAAIAIDRYFKGIRSPELGRVAISEEGHVVIEEHVNASAPHVVAYEEILNLDFFERKQRQKTSKLLSAVSVHSFEEMDKGMRQDDASAEAGRCFHCGHCTSCGCCVSDCPGLILAMTTDGPQVAHFDECWHCGCCRIACPSACISYEFPLNMLV